MAGEWMKPGAKCVCIYDAWGHVPSIRHPKLNEVLTIREVDNSFPVTALIFEGLGEDDCYRASYFKPLITKTMEQDLEQFNHLLNPSPLERLDRLAELLDLGY